MADMLEHPEISWALRTGYPSWEQEPDYDSHLYDSVDQYYEEYDEDAEYEARRDAKFDDRN